jgi:DNA-binding LytR/AlgR family response regulator
MHDGYFVLGAGILTAATFFINTLILPGFFPKTFNPEGWTVKKEIVQNICMFIFLSASFGMLAWLFELTLIDYSLPLFRTAALAMLPLILFNLLNYNNSLKMKMVRVIDTGKHWLAEERKGHHAVVKFFSENGKDSLSFDPEKLILMRSSGNYVEIYFNDGRQTRKFLLRQTLTTLEKDIEGYPQFKRSHRCCLVNVTLIERIFQNSGNWAIKLNGIDFEIPIARGKVSEMREITTSQGVY